MKLTIVMAKGLQFEDGSNAFLDPYVEVSIVSKDKTVVAFRTRILHGEHNPEWYHSEEVPSYKDGCSILFSIYDKDDFTEDTLLGTATLDEAKCHEHFDGELPLSTKGILHIRMTAPQPGVILDTYLVDNRQLQSDVEEGLQYCLSMDTNTVCGVFAPWDTHVHGAEENLGWLKVMDSEGPKYLPMFVDGSPVVEPMVPEQIYLVDNSVLMSTAAGLSFRNTRNLSDRDGDSIANWGIKLRGVEVGVGWIRVGIRYLPMYLDKVQVITLTSDDAREHALLEHIAIRELAEEKEAELEAQREEALAEAEGEAAS